MSHYDNFVELINKLQQQGGHKHEKLRLLRIILNQTTYLPTLTKTLRNVAEIKQQFKQDPQNTSSFATVAGEFVLNYMTDRYEDSLYSLSREQKQELIQRINTILESL